MNYLEQQRSPWRSLPGLLVVGLLHLVLIYYLVVILGKSVFEKPPPPIDTKVIKHDDKPPPPPPPPPPPDLLHPPPPPDVVPPPDIQLPTPPPQEHAIQAVVRSAAPPPAPVAKPAPAPTAPDVRFSAANLVGGTRAPEYPDQYNDSGKTGRVTVDCVIQTDGRPSNCRVLNQSGGAAFAQATMSWLTGGNPPRYRPESRGGVPQASEHQWVVSFQAPD